MNRVVSLTDAQLAALQAAAALLRTESRDFFVRDVVQVLETRCRCRSPSDQDLSDAIRVTLGVTAVTSPFLCDSAPTQEANMARSQRVLDLDEADEVLRDQEILRVPMYLMDGRPNPDLTPMQRLVAQDAAERQQARSLGLKHRPGFRFQTDAVARDAKARAYHDYETSQGEAWRAPPVAKARMVLAARRPVTAA
jgi:hypothetical protein